MTILSIQINLEGDAAQTLTRNGFSLYAYQGTDTNIVGWPTLWYKETTLSQTMYLRFERSFQAYTAVATNVEPPDVVSPSNAYAISEGQTLSVDASTGAGSVSTDGVRHRITISNTTTDQFTCGLTQQSGSGDSIQKSPTCALQLFGGNEILTQPQNKVLLAFESGDRQIGRTVKTLSAPSLLVSMDSNTARTVSYQLNTDWDANTESWATRYPAHTDLSGILVSRTLAPLVLTSLDP